VSLRGYQSDAIDCLDKSWSDGLLRLGIGLPTGTGKTHVMTELAARTAAAGQHVWILLHRDQLVIQTEAKMREHAPPGRTVGVVQGDRNVTMANIVVVSVHTLGSPKRLHAMRPPDLVIVDEAHVSMSPTYDRIFERYPNARFAGFTATWTRSDKRELGDRWQKIVFQRSIRWAIREGFLVPPRGVSVGAPEDLLDGVRTRGGDYVKSDLGAAVSVDAMRSNISRGYLEHGEGRSAVLFAPTRASAEYFREGLLSAGISAAGIYAGTSPRDRRLIFDAYRKRQVSVLTTCTALAEGWDAPWCSVALMARPTKHKGLYIQQVGRVLRPWPGKSDALVLDFVGAAEGMSLNLEAILRESMPDDPDADELEDERDPLEVGDNELTFKLVKGTKPVDLFAGTPAQWQSTDLGVNFVATKSHLYFLCPVDDTWSVGICSINDIRSGRWLRQGVSAEDALNYASIVAVDDDYTHAASDAVWRKGKISDAQVRQARSIGCPIFPEDRRGDLSDRLTWRQACVTLRSVGVTING
jgi:superfamily II DNA or RNA helicase